MGKDCDVFVGISGEGVEGMRAGWQENVTVWPRAMVI